MTVTRAEIVRQRLRAQRISATGFTRAAAIDRALGRYARFLGLEVGGPSGTLLVRDGLAAIAEWEAQHGALSEQELVAARARVFGPNRRRRAKRGP